MTAMASNDILIKRLTCRCIEPFLIKRYVKKKISLYEIKVDEVFTYELRGNKIVKDGLYSVIDHGYGTEKIIIKGDISELPNFTKEIK